MYITVTKVYRDRLGFNQATSKPVTDTWENRAEKNGTYRAHIGRRNINGTSHVFLWRRG